MTELQLQGRLDIRSSEGVRSALHEVISATPAKVVVNFQAVDFIDSAGLSALVSGLRVARERNKDLILIGLSKQTYKVFELTMLNRIFLIYTDLDELLQQQAWKRLCVKWG